MKLRLVDNLLAGHRQRLRKTAWEFLVANNRRAQFNEEDMERVTSQHQRVCHNRFVCSGKCNVLAPEGLQFEIVRSHFIDCKVMPYRKRASSIAIWCIIFLKTCNYAELANHTKRFQNIPTTGERQWTLKQKTWKLLAKKRGLEPVLRLGGVLLCLWRER